MACICKLLLSLLPAWSQLTYVENNLFFSCTAYYCSGLFSSVTHTHTKTMFQMFVKVFESINSSVPADQYSTEWQVIPIVHNSTGGGGRGCTYS